MENKEKRNYPIIDVPSDGKPKWCGGARTMAFVYSKHKGNFIVRGMATKSKMSEIKKSTSTANTEESGMITRGK